MRREKIGWSFGGPGSGFGNEIGMWVVVNLRQRSWFWKWKLFILLKKRGSDFGGLAKKAIKGKNEECLWVVLFWVF